MLKENLDILFDEKNNEIKNELSKTFISNKEKEIEELQFQINNYEKEIRDLKK